MKCARISLAVSSNSNQLGTWYLKYINKVPVLVTGYLIKKTKNHLLKKPFNIETIPLLCLNTKIMSINVKTC